MSAPFELAASRRAEALGRALARRRLVFVQAGSAFVPVWQGVLSALGGVQISASELLDSPTDTATARSVIITHLEQFASGPAGGHTLGSLRELVMSRIDSGQDVCLVSTAPRVAFAAVPGSSVLEDAAVFSIPLLDPDEVGAEAAQRPCWRLPAALSPGEADPDWPSLFEPILSELGTGVLTSLDHALFEVDPRTGSGVRFLGPRELEALRGSGLVVYSRDGTPELAVAPRLSQLKAALAELLSRAAEPHLDFAPVVRGLWYIERTIRSAVRRRAVEASGDRWRGNVIGGGLATEVLSRARADTCPTAASVRELRDPLEWLTLGELVDVARSQTYAGLGMDAILWRRLQEQLVPIRNRVSHMRHLRSEDEEQVTMWVSIVRREFD